MRKWEDIFKDKLEGYESSLPEGSLYEFQARLEGSSSDKKRFPLGWALSAAAVAAGLTAVMLLRQPSVPEGVQVLPQPATPVAIDTTTTDILEASQEETLLAQAISQKMVQHPAVPLQDMEKAEDTMLTDVVSVSPDESIMIPETKEDSLQHGQDEKTDDIPQVSNGSPVIPDNTVIRPIEIKANPVIGLMMGSGLLATVAIPMLEKSGEVVTNNSGINTNDGGTWTHRSPMKIGLSASLALSNRLNLRTGLDYSLYSSWNSIGISGKDKQLTHYLGIPVRLDWTLVSYNGLDLYVGGGVEGDYCISATYAGNRIEKDGLSFSMLGASGVQYRLSPRLGLFVEPEISWMIPSRNLKLETYRTEHPFMFSVAGGLRVFIGK